MSFPLSIQTSGHTVDPVADRLDLTLISKGQLVLLAFANEITHYSLVATYCSSQTGRVSQPLQQPVSCSDFNS